MFHGQISPRKRPLEQASPSQQVESKKTKFEEPIRTRRGPWTADEDELLTNLVKKFGTKKWALIAELVPGRVGKQCRERYLNHLRTDVKKTAWTEEEDMTLVRAQQELGNRWSAIARLLPGRPENSVKNRWNSLCNKRKRWSGSGDYEDSDGSTSADEQSAEDNSEGSSPGLKQQRTSGMVALSNEGANSVSIPYDVISDRGPSPQVAYCTDPNAFIWSLYSHRQQQMSQMYMSQQQQQQAKPLNSNNLLPEVRTPLAQTLSLPKALVVEQRCFSQVKANTPTQAVANRSPSATHESGTPLEEKRDSASGLMLLATLCT